MGAIFSPGCLNWNRMDGVQLKDLWLPTKTGRFFDSPPRFHIEP